MKVVINGKVREAQRLPEIISEVVSSVGLRMGLPEETNFIVEAVEFKVLFEVNGEEKYATVPREINGEMVNEMFMLSVHLDKDGNVIQTEDNEEESFYDGYTLAQALGKEYNYEGIESAYLNDELEIVESIGDNTADDVMSVKYKVIDNPEVEIVRHFKGDTLVAEYKYTPEVEEMEEAEKE